MENTKRITIDLNLTEFIKTGQFGFLQLGMTKAELESQLFPPEDWQSNKSKESSPLWRYGNFELYFDERQTLYRIFNDYIPQLDGGDSTIIKDWWLTIIRLL